MIKAYFIMLFGFIGLAFLAGWYVVDSTYQSTGRGIEQGLDAGIIKSGYVEDAQKGYVRLEEKSLQYAVKEAFRKNMNLDSQLENNIMKNSQFQLQLTHDSNGVPWIEVEFHTHVSLFIKQIQYPITVNRKIGYESIYK